MSNNQNAQGPPVITVPTLDTVLYSLNREIEDLERRLARERARVAARDETITTLRAEIAELEATIRSLRHQIQALRNALQAVLAESLDGGNLQNIRATVNQALGQEFPVVPPPVPGQTRETWQDFLIAFVNDERTLSYPHIYKLSCSESNIAWHPKFVHPHLRFRPHTPEDEELAEARAAALTPPSQRPETEGTAEENNTPSFNWVSLPLKIKVMILKHVLVFPGQVVHALTRLDPIRPAQNIDEFPRDAEGRPALLRRFHIGKGSCSFFYAIKPNELLAPLLVSRQWCFLGVHLFFSLNTFAFSSFREWGRFAKGIGYRIQRIQHIELVWVGSKRLVNERVNGKSVCRRTQPLLRLAQAIRLKTLQIYAQESSPRVMRRPDEPRSVIRYERALTHAQPNHRLHRAMRSLQGIDSVYCLRGMDYIRWYDLDVWLDHKRIQDIRDFSFLNDLNCMSTRPHAPDEEAARRYNMIRPVPENYTPTQEDWDFVAEALNQPFIPPDNSLPTPSPSPTLSTDSEDDDGDSFGGWGNGGPGGDHSPDEDDDGENASAPGSRRNAPVTPPTPETSPSTGPNEDVEMGDGGDDGDDGDDDSHLNDNDNNNCGDGTGDIQMDSCDGPVIKTETEESSITLSNSSNGQASSSTGQDDDDEVTYTGTRSPLIILGQGRTANNPIDVDADEGERYVFRHETPRLSMGPPSTVPRQTPRNTAPVRNPFETPMNPRQAAGLRSAGAVNRSHTTSPGEEESLFVSPNSVTSPPNPPSVGSFGPSMFETPQNQVRHGHQQQRSPELFVSPNSDEPSPEWSPRQDDNDAGLSSSLRALERPYPEHEMEAHDMEERDFAELDGTAGLSPALQALLEPQTSEEPPSEMQLSEAPTVGRNTVHRRDSHTSSPFFRADDDDENEEGATTPKRARESSQDEVMEDATNSPRTKRPRGGDAELNKDGDAAMGE